MTLEEFEIALKPKVKGTENLIKEAQSLELDFFLLLSSLSSVLGLSGQANYAAANSYLDDLAQEAQDLGLPIKTLNLGMVADSNVISTNQNVATNLLRAGSIPLSVQQFLHLFEYLISNVARAHPAQQIVVGISSTSMISRNPVIEKNALFSAFNAPSTRMKAGTNDKLKTDIKTAMLACTTPGELLVFVEMAVGAKMAGLLALKEDEIDHAAPISDIGMDSLIAIELKNWVGSTFQALLLTSDIMDAPDLTVLAHMILDKTIMTNDRVQEIQTEVNDSSKAMTGEAKLTLAIKENSDMQEQLQQERPALPLPDLKDTLEVFSQNMKPFCTESQLQQLESEIDDFLSPGGPGEVLQSRLLVRASNPEIEAWQSELYARYVYLRVRAPINPFQHFAGYYITKEMKRSQAESAAIVTLTVAAFKETLEKGELQPDYLNEVPQDMSSLVWLFNTVREPVVGMDVPRKYAGYDYLVVLRKGYVFKIDLKDGREGHPGFEEWKAVFESIIAQDLEVSNDLGVLTADERDSWANVSFFLLNIR